MDPRTETLTEMQIRIAREMQRKDPEKATYWLAMEKKARWYVSERVMEAKGVSDGD